MCCGYSPRKDKKKSLPKAFCDFFFPLLATLQHMESPDRGSDLSCTFNLHCNCGNTKSLNPLNLHPGAAEMPPTPVYLSRNSYPRFYQDLMTRGQETTNLGLQLFVMFSYNVTRSRFPFTQLAHNPKQNSVFSKKKKKNRFNRCQGIKLKILFLEPALEFPSWRSG